MNLWKGMIWIILCDKMLNLIASVTKESRNNWQALINRLPVGIKKSESSHKFCWLFTYMSIFAAAGNKSEHFHFLIYTNKPGGK